VPQTRPSASWVTTRSAQLGGVGAHVLGGIDAPALGGRLGWIDHDNPHDRPRYDRRQADRCHPQPFSGGGRGAGCSGERSQTVASALPFRSDRGGKSSCTEQRPWRSLARPAAVQQSGPQMPCATA
jgi:hypothetical protein